MSGDQESRPADWGRAEPVFPRRLLQRMVRKPCSTIWKLSGDETVVDKAVVPAT